MDDVEIRVTGAYGAGPAMTAATRDQKQLGDAAAKTARQMAEEALAARILDKQIAVTKHEMHELAVQISKTGDEARRLELEKSFDEHGKALAKLKKLKAELAQAGEEGGREFTRSFGDALGALPSQLKGAAIIAAVAAGIVLTPALGAAVGGAVTGGAGLGGIVGGVIAAAQDERVQQAGGELGTNFMSGFKDAGRVMVQPILDQMLVLQHAEDVVLSDMASGFAALAPVIKPVADGLDGLAENLDLDKIFGSSLPAVRAIAHELPEIGSAISDMFDSIDEGSDGATMGLLTVLHATEDLIRFTGEFIRVSSNVYEWLVRNGHAMTDFGLKAMDAFGWVEFIPGAGQAFAAYRDHLQSLNDETGSLIDGLDKAKDSGNDWRGNLADQARSTKDAAKAAEDYKKALEDLFGIQMSLDEANIRYQQAIDDTLKILKDGKKTLDINTQAGRDNKQAILDQISAIEDLRQANIDNGMAVDEANGIADGQLDRLRMTAIRLGFARDKVDELIGAYQRIPERVKTSMEAPGLPNLLSKVQALDKYMDGLDGRVVTTKFVSEFAEYRAGERNPSGHAAGGIAGGGPSMLHEQGWEMVELPNGSRVIPHGQSMAMLAQGGDGGRLQLEMVLPRASGLAWLDALVEGLRFVIRNKGGNDPQSFLKG